MVAPEKFKSSSVVYVFLLILGLSQTRSSLAAPNQFYRQQTQDNVVAPPQVKRTGHNPPAAAADWTVSGNIEPVDVAVETLEELKHPTFHNTEIKLKQDSDLWHLRNKEEQDDQEEVDELAEELKKLEHNETTPIVQQQQLSKSFVGQMEQDDKAGYFNEKEQQSGEETYGQSTKQQIQREQQQIDDEIQGEINKDQVETMKPRFGSAAGLGRQEHVYPARPTASLQFEKASELSSSSSKSREESQKNVNQTVPVKSPATVVQDSKKMQQHQEQLELLKETPHQNEDLFNLFTNNGNRRSVSSSHTPSLSVTRRMQELKLNKEIPLTSNGGLVTAHDLAQYVFWTGDEAGAAQAIDDLIEKGLMSRESAIKFLRDIRMSVDYLQNAYAADQEQSINKLPTTMEEEKVKVKLPQFLSPLTQFNSVPPASDLNYLASLRRPSHKEMNSPPTSKSVMKSLENLPALMKLNEMMLSRNEEMNNNRNNIVQSFPGIGSDPIDDTNGRLRLADFLYAEYTMEEVIYQLAKVMFADALIKGSVPAQDALQKFIGFIEVEASQGRISGNLQKKVIDVLMNALSDTMAEHPELLVMARAYLGNAGNAVVGEQ